jgi:hypothetical protein
MKHILFTVLFTGFLFLMPATVFAQNNNADSVAERIGNITEQEIESDTILNRHEYALEDDSMRQYRTDKDFAYMKYLDSLLRKTNGIAVDTFSLENAESVRRKKGNYQSGDAENSNKTSVLNLPFVKVILWLLAIFFIGFVVYKLFSDENIFKRNRSYKKASDKQPGEETPYNVAAYDTVIQQAVKNNNYRLAIRYLYLQTLHRLSDAGAVTLSAEKTNYQYVNELQGKPYQNAFSSVTLHYEYVWYGEFAISEQTFNKLNNEFKIFSQNL